MEKGFEKKLLIIMVIALLTLTTTEAISANGQLKNQYPGIMRFHVIANSNSASDQELKLEVRDYVMERLEKNLTEEIVSTIGNSNNTLSDSQIVRKYIEENLPLIEEWAKEAIAHAGYDYECSVDIGIRHIPAKYYDDLFFPEGNYEALNITIGKGQGQNWWCVVFPPLCLIDTEDSSYSETFNIQDEDKLVLKSKVKELVLGESSSEKSVINSISRGLQMSTSDLL